MKRTILSAMLTCCILIIILPDMSIAAPPPTATIPAAGSGTSSDPYHIAELNNLYWITQNTANWDKHYIQIKDIDASGTSGWDSNSGWTPIGNVSVEFTGSYNGLGSTIDGLVIDRSGTSWVGLFGRINGATIENLGVTNVTITGAYFTGGLAALNASSTISNSYTTGSVTGVESVGGLVGWNSSSTTITCYSTATVTGTSEVGGLVGYNQSSSTISNSYSTGAVTRSSGTEVSFGSFCGHNDGSTIQKSYATGAVAYTGTTDPTDKGFVGSETPTTTYANNLFDSETSVQSTGTGATAKTTVQMQTESTFTDAGWDFEGETTNGTNDYWDISGAYPFVYSPEGTEDHPARITSLADLISLSGTSADWGKYFIQTADIDASSTSALNSGAGFLPIGSVSPYFTGAYNGLGYTIDALFINRPSTTYVGLFGYTNVATIKNLGMTNVDITGQYYVGGLGGWTANSIISNCYSSGTVDGTNYIGGLIGVTRYACTVSNSYSAADVSGTSAIGGFLGTLFYSTTTTLTHCYSSGAVVFSASGGGFVGNDRTPTTSTVTNCLWDTETSGQSTSAAGIGKTTSEMTTDCTFLIVGWDFLDETSNGSNDHWTISTDNGGYPALTWQGLSNSGLSLPCVPYLTTTAVSSITKTTASSGGNVLSDNDASVTARGVCWDTSINPDISDSKTTDGTGTGSFTSSITGLTAATTYYLRAYATNSAGTNYGSESSFTTIYFNGSGTSGDPFQITSLSDLSYLAQHSAYWDQDYYFKQTVDIDATQTQYWDDADDDSDGDLYNDTNDGTSTGTNNGFLSIGDGNDEYYVSGTPFIGSYNGQGYIIDGLTINRGSTSYIGLFGSTYGATIENLGLTNIDITGGDFVGGVASFCDGGSIINECYTTGSVTGSGDFVGGLSGKVYGGDWGDNRITNSYSSANCSGDYYVGGVVGHVGGTIGNCYATGNVIGSSDMIGGLAGRVGGSGTVTNAYSTGTVNGSSDVGGLIGLVSGSGAVNNSFWDKTTSDLAISGGGTGKTTAEMRAVATFTAETTVGLTTAWDFETNPNDDVANDDCWDIDGSTTINNGYPYLSWQDGDEYSLPVELSSFNATTTRNNTITIEWVTESEIENLGFILERRASTSTWEVITNYLTNPALRGQGSVTYRTEYKYDDESVEAGEVYDYRLADVSYAGNIEYHHITILGVSPIDLPTVFRVHQNYPNPFNPITTIKYELSQRSDVLITLFDLNGREMTTLVSETQDAGYNLVIWDASNVSSGMYFYQIVAGEFMQTRKMVLLK